MSFDFLVVRQILPVNPASSVRGPKFSSAKGITPVLTTTTKLYDRTGDEITLDEIERIVIFAQ